MGTAVLTHLYTLVSIPPAHLGQPLAERFELGRFAMHVTSSDSDFRILDLDVAARLKVDRPDGLPPLILDNCSAVLITAGMRTAQLLLRHEVEDNTELMTHCLKVMCHERFGVSVNGTDLVTWIRERIPDFPEAVLGEDVFQVVDLDASAVGRLRTKESTLMSDAVGLIYREMSQDERIDGHSVRMPIELNRRPYQFGAHGRGVMVVAGHLDTPVAALTFVATQLLFAVGQLREIRHDLGVTLRRIQNAEDSFAGRYRDSVALEALTMKIRAYRTQISLDVSPAINGLDMPDLVLDNFRHSFGEALQLREHLASGITMLETLSELSEISLKEAQLASAERTEARERRWELLVGLVSGLVVPWALLISFFAVGTRHDVDSDSSMFDIWRYWLPWGLAILSMIVLAGTSAWRFSRFRARGASR